MGELETIKSKISHQDYLIREFKSLLEKSRQATSFRIESLKKERDIVNSKFTKQVYKVEKLKAYTELLRDKSADFELLEYLYSLQKDNQKLVEERMELGFKVDEVSRDLRDTRENLASLREENKRLQSNFFANRNGTVSPIQPASKSKENLIKRLIIVNEEIERASRDHKETIDSFLQSDSSDNRNLKSRIDFLETEITNLEEEKLKIEKDLIKTTNIWK